MSKLVEIHAVLLDLVGTMNSPRSQSLMLEEAGVKLDRALSPLLVRIGREGPIGVVDLAGRIGRDYTTVSRQAAKLETMGLVSRTVGQSDRRSCDVAITPAGCVITDAMSRARDRMFASLLEGWTDEDQSTLLQLMRRLADDSRVQVQALVQKGHKRARSLDR